MSVVVKPARTAEEREAIYRPRVAAQGARVLAHSDSTLRQLIGNDAPLAAHLLLNLSRALCAKLQQRSGRGAGAPTDPAG